MSPAQTPKRIKDYRESPIFLQVSHMNFQVQKGAVTGVFFHQVGVFSS